MSRFIPSSGSAKCSSLFPQVPVRPESCSSHPAGLVSLIAALASLGGGFSPWAVPPALLLGAFGLFAPAPAAADVLVSNVGEATAISSLTLQPVAGAYAQGFTTGANAGGYAVTSIEVVFQTAVGTPANLRVELWGADGSGNPDSSSKVSLTVPSTVGTGAVAFAAPSGTTLAASTAYFVVFYRSGATTGALRSVFSNSEDSGGASGWSIADAGHYLSQGTWTAWEDSDGYGIRVNGSAKTTTASTSIWSATLTVKSIGLPDLPSYGCSNALGSGFECSDTPVLSDDDFTFGSPGITYTVTRAYTVPSLNVIHLLFDRDVRTALDSLKFCVGSTGFAFSSAFHTTFDEQASFSTTAISWSLGDTVKLSIVESGASCPLPPPSLGYDGSMRVDVDDPWDPITINEGESITYGIALNQPPTATLTITPRHDNPHVDNGLLTIHNGVTWEAAESVPLIKGAPVFQYPNSHGFTGEDWLNPKEVQLTAVDDNECESPPGTRYWIRHHGSGGGPDWGDWGNQQRHHGVVIRIEIIDDDCAYLAPSPGRVYPEEGGSATYTVRLKKPHAHAAYISPRISAAGDSDIDAITVSPQRIRVEAGDTSPKTFTVSAGRDANSRNEVLIVDHSVDSPGIPADYLGARVTVVVVDEQNESGEERGPQTVTGLALTAGSEAVELSPAFAPGVTSYRASVPAGTARVTLAPHWSGGASVFAGSRRGATTFTHPARVRPSGTAVDLALAPDGGATELWVMASGGSGGMTTYRIAVVEAAAAQTVTVAFGNVPPEHDGRTAFALEVQSGSKPAAEAFTVTNGKVTGVESLDPVLWRVRVKPKSWKDVTVALGEAAATVRGPARIRVADARAKEGKDETLDFAVTLNRAAAGAVSVDYATEDGTATAGADYTAMSGTLTFAAGETEKTVSVALLDDAVDEGKETFKLKLSNPRGAYLRAMHREAKGVIRNADPLPSAWQIRFGRSVSQQVVDTLQQRFSTTTTPSGLQLTVAGEPLTSDTPLEENHVLLSRLLGFESVSSQEVAQGSSFSFSPEGAGPRLSFWGKGALSSFNGVEESVTLTGDVTTALLGAEWNNERWRAGAALSHSWGNGSYQGEGDGADGRISSTLTGIFPYGRYALTPRLGVWATAGYGWGSLSLNSDGDAPEYNPATTMTLGAVGMDGLLLDGGSEGVTLTTTADALFLKTTSEAVVGLASSEGNISRLRLGLEATRPFTLSNGASLSPSLEVGLRQDSGDAETGFGMDLGAGLSWSAPQQGITAAVKGRTLLSHGAEDFQDQGLALSFSWQPSPSNRGASLSLSHAVGLPADGGMAALLNPTAIELPDDANSDGEQFEARLAYGFPFYNNRLTLTPSVATALSTNSRSYSLLWSVVPYGEQLLGEPWELSLEGERQEHSSSTVDHSLKLLFSLPF